MKIKKISLPRIAGLVNQLRTNSEDAVGSYLYKGFKIQVSRYKLSGSERVMQLYRRRRKKGLCMHCGKNVGRINTRTGKLYQLCDDHRKRARLRKRKTKNK